MNIKFERASNQCIGAPAGAPDMPTFMVHPLFGNRRSTRLPDYDYRFGAFFFTLVTENRIPLLGKIVNHEVELSAEVGGACWRLCPTNGDPIRDNTERIRPWPDAARIAFDITPGKRKIA